MADMRHLLFCLMGLGSVIAAQLTGRDATSAVDPPCVAKLNEEAGELEWNTTLLRQYASRRILQPQLRRVYWNRCWSSEELARTHANACNKLNERKTLSAVFCVVGVNCSDRASLVNRILMELPVQRTCPLVTIPKRGSRIGNAILYAFLNQNGEQLMKKKSLYLDFFTSEQCAHLPSGSGLRYGLLQFLVPAIRKGIFVRDDVNKLVLSCIGSIPGVKAGLIKAIRKQMANTTISRQELLSDVTGFNFMSAREQVEIIRSTKGDSVKGGIELRIKILKQRLAEAKAERRRQTTKVVKNRRMEKQSSLDIALADAMKPVKAKDDMETLYQSRDAICNWGPDEFADIAQSVKCPVYNGTDITAGFGCHSVRRRLFEECPELNRPPSVETKATKEEILQRTSRMTPTQRLGYVENFNHNFTEPFLNSHQRKALRSVVVEVLRENRSLNLDLITKTKAGLKMLNFTTQVREKLTTDEDKANYCQVISTGPSCFGEKANEEIVLKFCLDSSPVELAVLGGLLNELSLAQLETIISASPQAVLDNMEPLGQHACHLDTRMAAVNHWLSEIGGYETFAAGNTIPYFDDLGTLVCHLQSEALTALVSNPSTKETFRELDGAMEGMLELDDCGCGSELREFLNNCKDNVLPGYLAGQTSSGRRKRAVLTCSDLENGLDQVVDNELDATVFTGADACIPLLNVEGLSTAQLQAIAQSAVQHLGSPRGWNAATVQGLGVILLGLNVSDIGAISSDITTREVVNAIVMKSVMTVHDVRPQYSILVDKALASENLSFAICTGAFLQEMGDAVYGISAENIGFIHTTAIDVASVALGQKMNYSSDQLTAWSNRAKAAVGDTPASWMLSKIESYGTLLAAVGSTFLNALNASQVQALTPDAVSLISSSDMSKLNSQFFEALSDGQKQAITASQREQLSAEILAIIDGSSGGGGGGGGGGGVSSGGGGGTAYNNNQATSDSAAEPITTSTTSTTTTTTTTTTAPTDTTAPATASTTETTTTTSRNSGTRDKQEVTVVESKEELEQQLESGDIVLDRRLDPRSLIKNLPANAGESSVVLDKVLRSDLTDAQKATVLRSVPGRVAEMATSESTPFDAGYVAQAIPFVPRSVVRKMSNAQVLDTVKNKKFIQDFKYSSKLGSKLGAALAEVSEADLPTKLEESNKALSGLSPKTFKELIDKIDVNNVLLEKLKNARLTRAQGSALIKEYLKFKKIDFSQMTASEQVTALEHIPANILTHIPIAKLNMLDPDVRRTIFKRLNTDLSVIISQAVYRPRPWLRTPPAGVSAVSAFDIGSVTAMSNDDKDELLATGAVSLVVADAMDKDYICGLDERTELVYSMTSGGAMMYNKCARPLTVEKAQRHAAVMSHAKSADISSLCGQQDTLDQFIVTLTSITDCRHMGGNAKSELVMCAKSMLSRNTTEAINDVEKCKAFSCVLPELVAVHREKLCPQTKKAMCEAIRYDDFTGHRQALTRDIMTHCFNRSVGLNLRTACSCGEMPRSLCGSIQGSDIEGGPGAGDGPLIACDDAVGSLDVLSCSLVNCSARKALYDCVKPQLPLTDSKNIPLYGSLLDQLTDAELDAIDSGDLCSSAESIAKQGRRLALYSDLRMFSNFKDDMSCLMNRARKIKILRKLQECENSATRRRRNSDTLTCDFIKTLDNSGKAALTSTELGSLSITEFQDCVEHLSNVDGFTMEQYAALASVAIQAHGAVSTWDEDVITSLGGIVSGLSTENLALLDLSVIDCVTAIGSMGIWSSAKLKVVFEEFLTDTHEGNATMVNRAQLRTMGDIICGATTEHIDAMVTDEICDALWDIGLSDQCEATQLQRFAAHAKKCYGDDVSGWEPYHVANMGSVVGGLSKAELSQLTKKHVESIQPWTMKTIPHTQFPGFTADQLGWLSTEQAASMTSDQYQALSSEQQAIIDEKLASVQDDLGTNHPGGSAGSSGKDSGSEILQASLLPVVTAFMAALMRI